MKPLLLIVCAALCFAATKPDLPVKEIVTVEASVNDTIRTPEADPYDPLGLARGSYLPGYGALFTMEMELIVVPQALPFRSPYSQKELEAMHDRKVKKLPVLKDRMRKLLAGASNQLDALPLDEQISMEAILWNYSWEDSHGLPQRIFMTAQKRKLLQAVASHADLSTVIEEQDR